MDKEDESNDIQVAIENTQFTEYVRFEGDYERRAHEKSDFMAGIDNAPDYDYPYLRRLNIPDENGNVLEDQKKQVYEALIILNRQRDNGTIGDTEYGLYGPFFDTQLKKIMLVEVASRMRHSSADSEVQQLAIREDFMMLNRDLYGEMDDELFKAILHTERKRVEAFAPGNMRAARIKDSLMSYFLLHRFEGKETVVSDTLLKKLHRLAHQRYRHILAAVPDTEDDKVYDASESQRIMQAALDAGGLAEKGWRIKIDPAKTNPSTSTWNKRITLPCDTARTAAQLRRLILHEQEVHARRAQNGEESGLAVLRSGTAAYSAVEEGLGVLMECAVMGTLENESFYRVRDRYITAGLALGLDGKPKDSRGTFSLLWRLIALRLSSDGIVREGTVRTAKEMAMKATENAFRGTNFLMAGIIYMKLKIYYEGLYKNALYFSENATELSGALDKALAGKHDHTCSDEIATVRRLLKKAGTNPAS
jgi:hypothetical protein